MGGLEEIVIMIEMRGMIPLIAGLVDSKRLPKVAVVVLSALSWFVGEFLFFVTVQHPIFKLLNLTWHLNWWIFKLIDINTRLHIVKLIFKLESKMAVNFVLLVFFGNSKQMLNIPFKKPLFSRAPW